MPPQFALKGLIVRVLVSGAGGFIGLPTIAGLVRSGREVHAVSTHASPPPLSGVQWHQLDLFDAPAVEQLVAELAPEQLLHLAWCREPMHRLHTPENVVWVEHSLRLLRAFVRARGRRVVMLGTCAEYDWCDTSGALVELASPVRPATLYGVAKDALRRVASAYLEQAEVELAWARPFFTYGPRESPGRLVASVVRALLQESTVVIGGGERVRDFMYVDDVANALVALLDSAVVGPVNIASGTGVRIGEIADRLVELTGSPDLVRREARLDRPGEPVELLADVSRLREEVGYEPQWGLADGLSATVRWWQAHERELSPHRC